MGDSVGTFQDAADDDDEGRCWRQVEQQRQPVGRPERRFAMLAERIVCKMFSPKALIRRAS